MSTYFWEVRTSGEDLVADEITTLVKRGVEDCLYSDMPEVVDAMQDVLSWRVVDTVGEGTLSTVVEINFYDEAPASAAPALSGGFDEHVLDRLIAHPGVREVSHSDRIRKGT